MVMKKALAISGLLCLALFPVLGQRLQYVHFDEIAKKYVKAAGPDNTLAQLAQKCLTGQSITQDYDAFARQVSLSADEGDQWAQVMLGLAYIAGRGVRADYVLAHMWSSLAGAGSDEKIAMMAREQRNVISPAMSQSQVPRAQELARGWKPKTAREDAGGPPVEKRSRWIFWKR